MNCKDFQKDLASGEPLTPQAADHARSCGTCGALFRILEGGSDKAKPDPARVAAIQQILISSLEPIRPLPSNGKLALTALVVAILLMLVCTAPFGYFGMRALSMGQIAFYYGVVLFGGVLLAEAIAEDIIPATKRILPRVPLIIGIFLVLIATVWLLFADSGTSIPGRGMACLRLGIFAAAIAGMAAHFFLRRGVLTTPVQTCCLSGTFAGLVGFGVLALHCPILTASHILPWHLGAMAISGCAGAIIGIILELVPRSRGIIAPATR